jgi:hypothetical protein
VNKITVNNVATGLGKFSEASAIATYAKDSAGALVKEGIVASDGKNLNPNGKTTRQEMASIIYKVYNNKV